MDFRTLIIGIAFISITALIPTSAQAPIPGQNGEDQPVPLILPVSLRNLVPRDCPVRDAQQTNLSPRGEIIIICGQDFLADIASTHVIVTDGHNLLLRDIDLDELSPSNGGFNHLEAAKEVSTKPNRHLFLAAFATAGDSSGSDFFAIAYRNGRYRVVLHRLVALGRVVFHPETDLIDIWDSVSGKCPPPDGVCCVWCLHPYKIDRYTWESGHFRRTRSRVTKGFLNPDEMVSDPILVDKTPS